MTRHQRRAAGIGPAPSTDRVMVKAQRRLTRKNLNHALRTINRLKRKLASRVPLGGHIYL